MSCDIIHCTIYFQMGQSVQFDAFEVPIQQVTGVDIQTPQLEAGCWLLPKRS